MPLQQLNKYLLTHPAKVPSATYLATKYSMETTSVSRILKRLGYERTTDGWYLPQTHYPLAVSPETANKLLAMSREELFNIYEKERVKSEAPNMKNILLACVGLALHDSSTRPIIL